MEIWRDIEGFEGMYQVSNTGRVKTLARTCLHNPLYNSTRIVQERIIKQCIRSKSHQYYYVNLSKNAKSIKQEVHRLVAIAFLGPAPFPGAQVNHKDGNKLNNNDWNLEWSTAQSNTHHSLRTGLRRMRLPYTSVLEIRKLHNEGANKSQIAEKFNISVPYVNGIINKRVRIYKYD